MRAGDHVRLTRDQPRLLGGGYRKGTIGIVRSEAGLLYPIVTVELLSGATISVPARDLRRTGGRGDEAFRRRREWAKAKAFAGLLLALPLLWSVAKYLISGGNLYALVPMVAEGTATSVLGMVLGLPLALVAIASVVIWLRLRR